MARITVAAELAALESVNDFVLQQLEGADCSMAVENGILMAVEEIFVNIAHYAYAPDTGEAWIACALEDGVLSITFEDAGTPYDPLRHEDPNIHAPVEERDVGGLGILMVKKLMDDVQYAWRDGKNCLTLTKRL